MKFSREQILGAPTFYRVAEAVNSIMPEYGEKTTANAAIEAYIKRQTKSPFSPYHLADKIRSIFRNCSTGKPDETVIWDCQLATTSIISIVSATKKSVQYSSADCENVNEAKCALAVARYLPDIHGIMRNDLKPLKDFVGIFCSESARLYANNQRLDNDLHTAACNLIDEAQQRLDHTVTLIQERLAEIKP